MITIGGKKGKKVEEILNVTGAEYYHCSSFAVFIVFLTLRHSVAQWSKKLVVGEKLVAAFCGLAPWEMISVVQMLWNFTQFMPFLEIYLTFYKVMIWVLYIYTHTQKHVCIGLSLEEEVLSRATFFRVSLKIWLQHTLRQWNHSLGRSWPDHATAVKIQ